MPRGSKLREFLKKRLPIPELPQAYGTPEAMIGREAVEGLIPRTNMDLLMYAAAPSVISKVGLTGLGKFGQVGSRVGAKLAAKLAEGPVDPSRREFMKTSGKAAAAAGAAGTGLLGWKLINSPEGFRYLGAAINRHSPKSYEEVVQVAKAVLARVELGDLPLAQAMKEVPEENARLLANKWLKQAGNPKGAVIDNIFTSYEKQVSPTRLDSMQYYHRPPDQLTPSAPSGKLFNWEGYRKPAGGRWQKEDFPQLVHVDAVDTPPPPTFMIDYATKDMPSRYIKGGKAMQSRMAFITRKHPQFGQLVEFTTEGSRKQPTAIRATFIDKQGKFKKLRASDERSMRELLGDELWETSFGEDAQKYLADLERKYPSAGATTTGEFKTGSAYDWTPEQLYAADATKVEEFIKPMSAHRPGDITRRGLLELLKKGK